MFKKVLFLIVFFSFFETSLSQHTDEFCQIAQTIVNPTISHIGSFKTLVVLCKFADDNFDLSPYTNLWPHTLNSMPDWGTNLISSSVQTSYPNPSISGYYKLMSNGLFNVFGDVVYYQPEHNQDYYSIDSGKHIGYLTEEILTAINQAPYNINFADYDNDGDGFVDMIQICFRFANISALEVVHIKELPA